MLSGSQSTITEKMTAVHFPGNALRSSTVIGHFLIEPVKHAWIVWKDSVIESTSHETWNKLCKQP